MTNLYPAVLVAAAVALGTGGPPPAIAETWIVPATATAATAGTRTGAEARPAHTPLLRACTTPDERIYQHHAGHAWMHGCLHYVLWLYQPPFGDIAYGDEHGAYVRAGSSASWAGYAYVVPAGGRAEEAARKPVWGEVYAQSRSWGW